MFIYPLDKKIIYNMVCVANELAQMLYKFFSRPSKQPAFIFNIMEKKITIDEWLKIISDILSEIAVCVKDDGKISMQDALNLLPKLITEIVSAYNQD